MKNKFMRIAAVMLMLCLVTTCAISGTFAKYTTEASGTDTARVAYWGFKGTDAEIALTDLFKTFYDNTNVAGKADVIAPGTTNSATFKFNYDAYDGTVTAPEVAYTFVVSLGDENATYCDTAIQNNTSIKWSLTCTEGSTETKIVDNGTWTALTTAIEALDGNVTDNKYAANTLPEAFDNDQVYTISWVWDFEGNDTTDTGMGNATELADCKITITITATQVD